MERPCPQTSNPLIPGHFIEQKIFPMCEMLIFCFGKPKAPVSIRGFFVAKASICFAGHYEIWRPAWVTLAAKRSQGLTVCLASSLWSSQIFRD